MVLLWGYWQVCQTKKLKRKKETIMIKNVSLVAIFAIIAGFGFAEPAEAFKFGDVEFTQRLCNAWNRSSLPKRLGEKDKKFGKIKGNGWIDHATGVSKDAPKKGYQKIVFGRRDCSGWPKMQLVIEKDDNGKAVCKTSKSGRYNGRKMTWQFTPRTEHWFDLAQSFWMTDFSKLMSGFKGPMWFAKQNQGNFQIFWRLGARIGLSSDWKSGCKGIDADDVKDEIEDYKEKFNIK
jgi:hypothetical protein